MDQSHLLQAIDRLQSSIEPFRCSHFQCVLGYNAVYFLQAYNYILDDIDTKLPATEESMTQGLLQGLFYDSCFRLSSQDIINAPFSQQTKRSQFLDNICQMLNMPFFEQEMQKHQTHPSMIFMQTLWSDYTDRCMDIVRKATQPL